VRIAFPITLALLCWAPPAWPAELSPGDDVRAAIRALKPGDELLLRGGTYTFDSAFRITVNGTAAQPVVIRAKGAQAPVIHQTNPGRNVLEIYGSSHLVVRGIAFRGGSHGIRLMSSNHITIESCEIHDTGDVALSANAGGTYTGLRLLRNHIHHTNGTGEGMYLGCNNDACRVADSLIEGNYIHHTNGPTVDQGDGIELKEGSYGNVIRHNVIHDTRYPNILTYGTVGNGPPNVIEGNVMWGSGDNALQVAADAIIRNNIILGAPVAFQAHQSGSPSGIQFVHNTVITPGTAVNVRDVSGSVVIANNAVYSKLGRAIRLISGNLGLVVVVGNVGTGGLTGASDGYTQGGGISSDFVAGHFDGGPPIDLFPAPGGALPGAGVPEWAISHDFNEEPRGLPVDAGAYGFQVGGNPGWAITRGFKPMSGSVPRAPVLYHD
jgi:hypothetical protein